MKRKKIKERRSKIRCALILAALQASWMVPCSYMYHKEYVEPKQEIIVSEINNCAGFHASLHLDAITVEEAELPVVAKAQDVPELVSLGTFRLTAYCNCTKCCGKWAGGPTASGTMPQAGRTIAVDTSIIPMGTQVMINGRYYIAEDTGSGIDGNCIDIYFDSHEKALEFGVKYMEVFVYASK